jgi:hypothetical protein
VGIGYESEGCCGSPDYYFNGLEDEVSLYHRALSASEIQAIYNAGSYGKCAPLVPPSIITQPANQNAIVGGTAAFSVTAGGTAPLSYQWSVNGTNILNGTNATLTLNNVQASQAGNYAVQVANAYGSTNSASALLTVISSCVSPPSDMIAWWQAENNGIDVIGGNNGTLLGGATFTSGKVGQTFSFNGVGGCVSIPDSPALDALTNSITVEAWFKFNQTNANASWAAIATKGKSSWRLMGIQGAKTLLFYCSGPNVGATGTRNVNDGQWHHVVGTYDGANVSLYVDGTLDAVQPGTGPIAVTSSIAGIGYESEGCCGSPDYYFNGWIDEVSLYNCALSADEIKAICTEENNGKPLPQ